MGRGSSQADEILYGEGATQLAQSRARLARSMAPQSFGLMERLEGVLEDADSGDDAEARSQYLWTKALFGVVEATADVERAFADETQLGPAYQRACRLINDPLKLAGEAGDDRPIISACQHLLNQLAGAIGISSTLINNPAPASLDQGMRETLANALNSAAENCEHVKGLPGYDGQLDTQLEVAAELGSLLREFAARSSCLSDDA